MLTYEQQIDVYRDMGLICENSDVLAYHWSHVGYLRLERYAEYFLRDGLYRPGTTFDDIAHIYEFDNALRLLFLGYIQNIEYSFQNSLIVYMDHTYGSKRHINNAEIQDLCISVQKSKQKEVSLMPAHSIIQYMSFGETIKLYRCLSGDDRIAIASLYGIHGQTFSGWLYCLRVVRNVCAHGEVLRNRKFDATLHKPMGLIGGCDYTSYFLGPRKKVYDYLIVILILLKQMKCNHRLIQNLDDLLCRYDIHIQDMGFPLDRKEGWVK